MRPKRLSQSELYGKGIFTTVAVNDRKPFLWDKHWSRIVSNASALEIDLSNFARSTTLDALNEAVAESGLTNGRARLTFSDASPSPIWPHEASSNTSLSIIVAERRPVPDFFRITISRYRINTTSPLIGIKSCNYLQELLSYKDAAKRGSHEAIRLNERGELTSACMANMFWENDGKLFTPSLKTGCLPGTTREFVLENLDCVEVEQGIDELETAERIFLTSAGIGVVKVAEFDGRRLDTSPHKLKELINWAG